jgi:hypothetical protein
MNIFMLVITFPRLPYQHHHIHKSAMMIKIMRLISMKLVVITLLSVFGCCGHGGVFASKRQAFTIRATSGTLCSKNTTMTTTNLGGGGQEAAAGHVNTRRTAKSVPESDLDSISASHSTPEMGHHMPPQNLIINRHHEGDIFAATGRNINLLYPFSISYLLKYYGELQIHYIE